MRRIDNEHEMMNILQIETLMMMLMTTRIKVMRTVVMMTP